jgi:hypothetical protein
MSATDRDVIEGIRARRLPIHYRLPNPGDITRYGATPGVDCTAIITTAAAANSEVIFPAGAWVISSTPAVPDNVLLTALPGATFSGSGAKAIGLPSNPTGFQALFFRSSTLSGQTPIQAQTSNGIESPYHFYVLGDTVDTTTLGNANLRYLAMNGNINANHTGGRSALFGQLVISGTPAVTPTVGYVGAETLVQCSANLTGTAGAVTNYKGGIYGANPWARTRDGATFLYVVNSSENDVSLAFGTSAAHKHGLTIVKTQDDVNKADYSDTAFLIGDQDGFGNSIPAGSFITGRTYKIATVGTTDFTLIGATANTVNTYFCATGPGTGTGTAGIDVPAWTYGVGFGNYSSQWPFDANSTLIYGWQRQVATGPNILAAAVEVGRAYKIINVGTTNFTLLGAASNTVGLIFVATSAGSTVAGTSGSVSRGWSVAGTGIDFTNVLFTGNSIQAPGFSVGATGKVAVSSSTATPAGGSAAAGLTFGTTGPNVHFGSGAPTLTAQQGSLYLRTDGSSTSTRMYVATDSVGGWTNVTTAT